MNSCEKWSESSKRATQTGSTALMPAESSAVSYAGIRASSRADRGRYFGAMTLRPATVLHRSAHGEAHSSPFGFIRERSPRAENARVCARMREYPIARFEENPPSRPLASGSLSLRGSPPALAGPSRARRARLHACMRARAPADPASCRPSERCVARVRHTKVRRTHRTHTRECTASRCARRCARFPRSSPPIPGTSSPNLARLRTPVGRPLRLRSRGSS